MIKKFIDQLISKATGRPAAKPKFGKRLEIPAAEHGIDRAHPLRGFARGVTLHQVHQQVGIGGHEALRPLERGIDEPRRRRGDGLATIRFPIRQVGLTTKGLSRLVNQHCKDCLREGCPYRGIRGGSYAKQELLRATTGGTAAALFGMTAGRGRKCREFIGHTLRNNPMTMGTP